MENSAEFVAKTSMDIFSISNQPPERAFIWSLGAIKYAAARVNGDLGSLDNARAEAIAQAAREVMTGWWDRLFIKEPQRTAPGDYHRVVDDLIAARATSLLEAQPGLFDEQRYVDPQAHVNQNQAGPEVISTSLRLGCLKGLQGLLGSVAGLTLRSQSIPWQDLRQLSKENHRDGQATPMGAKLHQCLAPVMRCAEMLREVAVPLQYLSLQGPAATDARPEHPSQMVERLAEITGFRLYRADHSAQSIQAIAEIDAFSTALRNMAFNLRYVAEKMQSPEAGNWTQMATVHPKALKKLEEVTASLQGCDLIIALAAQVGATGMEVMMPVVAHTLFGAEQAMCEAVQQIAFDIAAGPAGVPLMGGFPIPADFPEKWTLGNPLFIIDWREQMNPKLLKCYIPPPP